MLLLHESAAGFALFKVDDKKIKKAETGVGNYPIIFEKYNAHSHACM
jgi:hypothetical protein